VTGQRGCGPPRAVAAAAAATGAAEDNGIHHNKNRLGFTYVFMFAQSHYLHPHPYLDRSPWLPPPPPTSLIIIVGAPCSPFASGCQRRDSLRAPDHEPSVYYCVTPLHPPHHHCRQRPPPPPRARPCHRCNAAHEHHAPVAVRRNRHERSHSALCPAPSLCGLTHHLHLRGILFCGRVGDEALHVEVKKLLKIQRRVAVLVPCDEH
jgi:hypothetical protein